MLFRSRSDCGVCVAEDDRAVTLDEIDISLTFDVLDECTLAPGDDVRLTADCTEGTDGRVDSAGDDYGYAAFASNEADDAKETESDPLGLGLFP